MMKGLLVAALVLSALLHARATGEEQVTADQLYGCWRRDDSQRGGVARASTVICFRKDLTAERRWIESDGHGGNDGPLEWYLSPEIISSSTSKPAAS
jgi:hypothetical protein